MTNRLIYIYFFHLAKQKKKFEVNNAIEKNAAQGAHHSLPSFEIILNLTIILNQTFWCQLKVYEPEAKNYNFYQLNDLDLQ